MVAVGSAVVVLVLLDDNGIPSQKDEKPCVYVYLCLRLCSILIVR